jgi:hypothetical protein
VKFCLSSTGSCLRQAAPLPTLVGLRLAPIAADLCDRGLTTLVCDYFVYNI